MKIIKRILKLIYPETCVFCGKVCKTGICNTCVEQITYVEEPCCKRCGKPVRYEEQEYCHDCEGHTFAYEQGKSVWLHKGLVKQSIYRFKYHNKRVYASVYAREMLRLYEEQIKSWKPQVLIPVPLHWRRRQQRGYNQAMILAREVSKRTGIPFSEKIVRRRRCTSPQKRLNKKQRSRNLQDAFEVTEHLGKIKSVLIIDDIYTTGSTIDSIARKLKEKGVQKVWFLTISIGQGF